MDASFGLARLVSAGRRWQRATGSGHGQGPLVPSSAGPLTLATATATSSTSGDQQ